MYQKQIPLPIHLHYSSPSVITWIAGVFILLVGLAFLAGAVFMLTAADTKYATYPNWPFFSVMLVGALFFIGLFNYTIIQRRMQLAVINAKGVITSKGKFFDWQNLVQVKIYTADHLGIYEKRMKQKVVFEFNSGKVKYYGSQPDFYLVSDIVKHLPFHFQEIYI